MEKILEMLKIAKYVSAKEYAKKYGVDLRSAEMLLSKLESEGLLERHMFSRNNFAKNSGGVLYTTSTRGKKMKIKKPDGKIIDENGRECITLRDFLAKNPGAKYVQYPHLNFLIEITILAVSEDHAFIRTNGVEKVYQLDNAELFLTYDPSR